MLSKYFFLYCLHPCTLLHGREVPSSRGGGEINKENKIGKLYAPIRLAQKAARATLRPSTMGEGNKESKFNQAKPCAISRQVFFLYVSTRARKTTSSLCLFTVKNIKYIYETAKSKQYTIF